MSTFPKHIGISLSPEEAEEFKRGARRMVYYVHEDGRMLLAEDSVCSSETPSDTSRHAGGQAMKDLRTAHWQEIRDTVTGKREQVYLALCTHGPCTPKELAEAMGWDKTSVRPRITELVDAYHAKATGERRNGEHVFAALSHAEAHLIRQANQPKTTGWFVLEYSNA